MRTSVLILYSSWILSTVSIGAGYVLAGYWPVLLVLVLLFLFWILMSKRASFLMSSVSLTVYVSLAVIGILAGLSASLMILASTTALVSWDLVPFRRSTAEETADQTYLLLEKVHMRALGLAASSGLMLSMIIQYFHLQIPFFVTAALGLMAVGCLTYGLRYIIMKLG